MNITSKKNLTKAAKSTLLIGLGLTILTSCESLPYTPFTYVLDNPDLVCAAIEMDKEVFNIEETKENPGWYTLWFNSTIELDEKMVTRTGPSYRISDYPIYVNPKERLISVSDMYNKISYSKIEEDSCSRTFLKKAKNPYAVDVGSSIEYFNFSKPKIEFSNKKVNFFVSKEEGKKSLRSILDKSEVLKRVDWEQIQDFNLKAFDIWEEYSKKYSNEEIRKMFFDDDIKEFMDLKAEVSMALTSASFKTTFNKRAISHYHPAFSQIILDLYIFNDNFNILENRIKSYGTPSDIEVEEYGQNAITEKRVIDFVIGNTDKYPKNTSGLPFAGYDPNDPFHNMTTRFANLAVLVQTFSHGNCYEWGLRPEITRFTLPYRLSGMTPFITVNRIGGDHLVTELYEEHIVNSLFNACGDISKVRYLHHKFIHDYTLNYDDRYERLGGANNSLLSPYIVLDHEDIVEDAIKRAKR